MLFRLRLYSLSLCTLQTMRLLSLSWPIEALSHVFSLRNALKLLLALHKDTSTMNKILTRTLTWSNCLRPPLAFPLGPLLLLHCCYRGISCERGATVLGEPLCNSGYTSNESLKTPVRGTLYKFCRVFRLSWLNFLSQ